MKIITHVPPRPPEPPVTYDIVGLSEETLKIIMKLITIEGTTYYGKRLAEIRQANRCIYDFMDEGFKALNGR